MAFRICYIIIIVFTLATITASYPDSCSVIMNDACTYTVTCTDTVDSNLDWTRFSRRHEFMSISEETCEHFITYSGYKIFPVRLVFKQSSSRIYRQGTLVPMMTNHWGSGHVLNVIKILDLSDDGYTESPSIRSMQNLMKLDLSTNKLTTAVLSNQNELSMLTEIDLSHNTINNIQVNSNEYPYKKLIKIDISHNYLVKIPDAIFDEFDDLQTLDLSYNYIDTLSQFTFEGVKQLTDLNLSYNRLTSINSSLFRFIELKTLDLKGNRIDDIKIADFQHLRNLNTLDISSNTIKEINFDLFNTMGSLENLYLSNNQLETINKNALTILPSLASIDLSKNRFKYLPKNLFKNNTILTFSIEENILQGALEKGMFNGVNATKLDFSNQFLTEVKDYAFQDLVRLETLLFNSNNIHLLSKMCFKTLINLQTLDLSSNELTNIDFDKEDLHNLRSLLLKNNRLTEINHEQLQQLSSLELLDLSNNQIARLEPKSFQSLKNLINLRINSNPLLGILQTGTFDGLISLPSLEISHNMLTTIQNASFNDMNQLKELNMSHCKINELQYNAFIGTEYIETLDLSYNKLDNFLLNTTHLTGIFTLLLNNNLIKTVSPSSLKDLSRLNMIILSYNIIENIDNESFNNLLDIRHIDLSYNEQLKFDVNVLEKIKSLNAFFLSGVKTNINFANIANDSPIPSLGLSNATIRNISALNLAKVAHLDSLDLSFNNVSKLQIGDFTGISTLRTLDLSFNQITYIQPGVFKDNSALNFLNISHNSLSSISYGIFRGLIYLSILDFSYNNIEDLKSERFYELKSLSQLIVDNNKIYSLNAEEFVGTSLSRLSIGDNPLPCQILVKLNKNGIPFEITAIRIDEHSNENVNGVTCNRDHKSSPILPAMTGNHNDILNRLPDILHNFTNSDTNQVNTEHLEKISNILEKSNSMYDDKLSNLANLTSKVIAINNETNILITKIIDSLLRNSALKDNFVPNNKIITTTTTHVPLIENDPSVNKTDDIISYIKKVRKDLEDTIMIQKQNIIKEIESKLGMNSYHPETLPSNVSHEQLVSSNESTKSYFTEICVALILLILVGLVLYKFYKSRMFIRNRFSFSTRELPGSMENSAL